MQASVPKLVDFSHEPEHILHRSRFNVYPKGTFTFNCLVTRRLPELSACFVQ